MNIWLGNRGHRVGAPLHTDPIDVISYEAYENDNRHVFEDACDSLDVPQSWTALAEKLLHDYPGWKAVWLCDSEAKALARYGNGNGNDDVYSYTLPRGSIVLCLLPGDEGALWLLP